MSVLCTSNDACRHEILTCYALIPCNASSTSHLSVPNIQYYSFFYVMYFSHACARHCPALLTCPCRIIFIILCHTVLYYHMMHVPYMLLTYPYVHNLIHSYLATVLLYFPHIPACALHSSHAGVIFSAHARALHSSLAKCHILHFYIPHMPVLCTPHMPLPCRPHMPVPCTPHIQNMCHVLLTCLCRAFITCLNPS